MSSSFWHHLTQQSVFCQEFEERYVSNHGETSTDAYFPNILSKIQPLIDTSIAKTIQVSFLSSKPADFLSISIKESYYDKPEKLPIGARTLVLNPDNGTIVMRGINKFFDLASIVISYGGNELFCREIDSILGQNPNLQIFMWRKMAGFVISMFSLDGIQLNIISKHASDGLHVHQAYDIIGKLLNLTQQRKLATELFERSIVWVGECVVDTDIWHPLCESTKFQNNIWWFSALRRTYLRECTIPTEIFMEWVNQYGLSLAPVIRINSGEMLLSILDSRFLWNEKTEMGDSFSEGMVFLFEFPHSLLFNRNLPECVKKSFLEMNDDYNSSFRFPLRFKLKFLAYRLFRQARSLLFERQSLSATHPMFWMPYLHIFVTWLNNKLLSDDTGFSWMQMTMNHGVTSVLYALEREVFSRKRRMRSGLTPAVQWKRMQKWCERYAMLCEGEVPVGDNLSYQPVVPLLFCGLPGSGKTSICERLFHVILKGSKECQFSDKFGGIIWIQKDAIQSACLVNVESSNFLVTRKDVLNQYQSCKSIPISQLTSRRKRRSMTRELHNATIQYLLAIRSLLAYHNSFKPVLLLLDGCHARAASRSFWRKQLGSFSRHGNANLEGLENFFPSITVYITCQDERKSVERLRSRAGHVLFTEVDEGQLAWYRVSRIFEPPTLSDDGFLVTFDTSYDKPDFLAEKLLQTIVSNSLIPSISETSSTNRCENNCSLYLKTEDIFPAWNSAINGLIDDMRFDLASSLSLPKTPASLGAGTWLNRRKNSGWVLTLTPKNNIGMTKGYPISDELPYYPDCSMAAVVELPSELMNSLVNDIAILLSNILNDHTQVKENCLATSTSSSWGAKNLFRRFKSWVWSFHREKSKLSRDLDSTISHHDAILELGHIQWLSRWLNSHLSTRISTGNLEKDSIDPSMIMESLENVFERFDQTHLHVTLAFGPANLVYPAFKYHIGTICSVLVHHVIFDVKHVTLLADVLVPFDVNNGEYHSKFLKAKNTSHFRWTHQVMFSKPAEVKNNTDSPPQLHLSLLSRRSTPKAKDRGYLMNFYENQEREFKNWKEAQSSRLAKANNTVSSKSFDSQNRVKRRNFAVFKLEPAWILKGEIQIWKGHT